jgi:hypothetical protein
MAASRLAKTLSANAKIGNGRSRGVMMRSREKRNRRPRRAASQRSWRDHRDEPLRVLVRVLARQAARERFEREVASERESYPR